MLVFRRLSCQSEKLFGWISEYRIERERRDGVIAFSMFGDKVQSNKYLFDIRLTVGLISQRTNNNISTRTNNEITVLVGLTCLTPIIGIGDFFVQAHAFDQVKNTIGIRIMENFQIVGSNTNAGNTKIYFLDVDFLLGFDFESNGINLQSGIYMVVRYRMQKNISNAIVRLRNCIGNKIGQRQTSDFQGIRVLF